MKFVRFSFLIKRVFFIIVWLSKCLPTAIGPENN